MGAGFITSAAGELLIEEFTTAPASASFFGAAKVVIPTALSAENIIAGIAPIRNHKRILFLIRRFMPTFYHKNDHFSMAIFLFRVCGALLALRPLWPSAGLEKTWLLALNHAAVTREKSGCAEARLPLGIFL